MVGCLGRPGWGRRGTRTARAALTLVPVLPRPSQRVKPVPWLRLHPIAIPCFTLRPLPTSGLPACVGNRGVRAGRGPAHAPPYPVGGPGTLSVSAGPAQLCIVMHSYALLLTVVRYSSYIIYMNAVGAGCLWLAYQSLI